MNDEQKTEETTTGGVASHVDDLEGDIPDVSEHVVKEVGEPEAGADLAEAPPIEDEYAGLTDKYGRPFDPVMHVTDGGGKPLINRGKGKARGFLTIRAGVRRPKATKSKVKRPRKKRAIIAPEPEPSSPEAPSPEPEPSFPPDQAALIASSMTFQLGMMVFGEDGAPIRDQRMGIDEAFFMKHAYENYFRAKGVRDIPPGWLILIAVGDYSLRRLTMPRPQQRFKVLLSKFGKAGRWISSKFRIKPAEKKEKKVEAGRDGAQSDTRDDGERKDDFSEVTMPNAQKARVGSSGLRSVE